MSTLKYYRRVAPKTAWKYVRRVSSRTMRVALMMSVFIWALAWLLSSDASASRGMLYNYQVLIYPFLVVVFLAWQFALSGVEKELGDEHREMLQQLLVEGLVNSASIYRDTVPIDVIFSRIREVVSNNTRVDFYNEYYVWDFEELLTVCLSDLKRDVDASICAELS